VARFETVLFDLDGTLIDSGPSILASFHHAVHDVLGRGAAESERIAFLSGWSLRAQMALLDELHAEELVEAYRAHNEPLHELIEAFPGALELLDELEHDGRVLGLVTAKRRVTAELAFARIPLARYFDVVVTADHTTEHKPHPAPLLRALAQLGVEAETAVYVGDSPGDVAAAKAAGIAAIGVTWGGMYPAGAVHAQEPDYVVSTREELRAVLA